MLAPLNAQNDLNRVERPQFAVLVSRVFSGLEIALEAGAARARQQELEFPAVRVIVEWLALMQDSP